MNKKWYEMSENEIEAELSTSIINGLSKKAAASRLRKKGGNVIFKLPHGSFSSYLKDIVTDSSSVILILTALIASAFESSLTSYIVITIIALNCFVSLFTYVKAQRVMEEMGEYSLPGAKVIRDGRLYLTGMTSLVPGDLIYLKAGDIVPADARVISSDNFYVSEHGITSNISAIRKSPKNISVDNNSPENLFNIIFATSVVLKGSARAVVVETGNDTYVKATDKNILSFESDELEIISILKNYGNKISMLMLAMVILIMFLEMVFGYKTQGLYEIFLNGMSLAVAAMTEFYIAFGYIIIACGLFGAKTNKSVKNDSAVLRNIKSIEKLKDINCVIFKQDGVISDRAKYIDTIYSRGQLFETKNKPNTDDIKAIVEGAVVSTGLYMKSSLEAQNSGIGRRATADEAAVIDCAERLGIYNIELDKKYPILMHTAAGRNSKYSMTAVEKEGKIFAYVKGPAADMLKKCRRFDIGNSEIPIDTQLYISLSSVISEQEKSHGTVYAIGFCQTEIGKLSNGIRDVMSDGLTLMGFMTLKSSMFENCALTVGRLINAGIRVIINSPNANSTDIAISKNLGISKSNDDILTPEIYERLNDDQLKAAADNYSVFYGLQNAQIRKMISILKENGNKIAYCAGDLNEITVMETADIGISLSGIPKGKRGSKHAAIHNYDSNSANDNDALRVKSDVIIPSANNRKEGGILAISRSILTSKLIYKNTLNMIAYLITVQFARLFVVLYSVFTQNTTLSPIQILFGGLIVDLLAVLSIAFTRPNMNTFDDYRHATAEIKNLTKFCIKNSLFGIFWAAMTIFIPMIIGGIGFDMSGADFMNCAFVSFTLTQFFTLAENKRIDSIFKPSAFNINPFFAMSIVSVIAFFVICLMLPSFGGLFNIAPLNIPSVSAIIFIVMIVVAIQETYKYINKH